MTREMSQAGDQNTSDLVLYYSRTCVYCMRVLNVLRTLDVNIGMRNLSDDRAYRQELIQGGGRGTVPCLRITKGDGAEHWMYESSDISAYLSGRFSPENR